MANRRNNRLSGEMKRVISEVIRNEVKDPRLSELLSVTDVDVMGFIRREVGKRIKMRLTPELLFEKDDSIEKGIYMSSLINKVIEDEESRKPKDES